MDQKPTMAARTLKLLLAPDFHDRAVDAQSIPLEKEIPNRTIVSRLASETDLEWLYQPCGHQGTGLLECRAPGQPLGLEPATPVQVFVSQIGDCPNNRIGMPWRVRPCNPWHRFFSHPIQCMGIVPAHFPTDPRITVPSPVCLGG
jgi:hypothetical protein